MRQILSSITHPNVSNYLTTDIELRSAAGTGFTSILARIGENAMKLALIVAVGRDATRPVIEVHDAEWAIRFVRYFVGRAMEAVERHVADTETEAQLKRLREIIRAAGSGGLTKSELTRASQWLKGKRCYQATALRVAGA